MFAAQTITGAWLCRRVTVELHVAVWAAASLTTNVLVVTPTGNNEPLARPAVWTVLEPGQLSVPRSDERRVGPARESGSLLWAMLDGPTLSGAESSSALTQEL